MGTFYAGCVVVNLTERNQMAEVPKLLVDTGSECTWINKDVLIRIGVTAEKKGMKFLMANGKTLTRNVGFAVLRVGDRFTVDEVVFALEGDLQLLGARTLEGLNLTVDPARKRLIGAGPLPAAAADGLIHSVHNATVVDNSYGVACG